MYVDVLRHYGGVYAEYQLGKIYLTKENAQHNRELALYWLTRSTKQGNEYAQYFVGHWDQITMPAVMLAVTQLLYHLSRIFQNSVPPRNCTTMRPHIDRKLLARMRERKIALGHKPDDREDPLQEQMSMGM